MTAFPSPFFFPKKKKVLQAVSNCVGDGEGRVVLSSFTGPKDSHLCPLGTLRHFSQDPLAIDSG